MLTPEEREVYEELPADSSVRRLYEDFLAAEARAKKAEAERDAHAEGLTALTTLAAERDAALTKLEGSVGVTGWWKAAEVERDRWQEIAGRLAEALRPFMEGKSSEWTESQALAAYDAMERGE